MSDSPYESPREENTSPWHKKRTFSLGRVVLAVAAVLLLVALLLPFGRRVAPEAARRNGCINNLKQIGVALHNYHDQYGSLPPAYTVDAAGNRLHSWRTLILPYMEEQALYESIDLTKPWDDPANAHARSKSLDQYWCPSTALDDEYATTYLAAVGPENAFPGSVGRKFSEVTDGTSKTIAVIDAPQDRAVHWMSPHDITVEEILAIDQDDPTQHIGVMFNALYCDAHVGSISFGADRKALQALLTAAAGEKIDVSLD